MTRPSPVSRASREWLWMSMNPGQTTRPFASIRSFAAASFSKPAGAIRAIRPPLNRNVAVEPGVAGAVDDPAPRINTSYEGVRRTARMLLYLCRLCAVLCGHRRRLAARCEKRTERDGKTEKSRSECLEHIH